MARSRRRPRVSVLGCAGIFLAAWLLAVFLGAQVIGRHRRDLKPKTEPSEKAVEPKKAFEKKAVEKAVEPKKASLGNNCAEMLEGSRGFAGTRYWRRSGEPGAAELDFPRSYRGKNNDLYCSFEVDNGGFNNVRMALETVAVFAHATGRRLVVPPKQRVYLLKETHAKNLKAYHGLGAFLNFDALGEVLPLMTGVDFAETRAKKKVAKTLAEAAESTGEPKPRKAWREWQRSEADLLPRWDPMREVVIFGDGDANSTDPPWRELSPRSFATNKRRLRFLDETTASKPWIHFASNGSAGYRLFSHWYTFFLFMDGPTNSFYKRFVRDRLRYTDDVFCAAGAVVRHIGTSFSSVHVRRGELQYAKVRISAEAWRDSLQQWLLPHEKLFVLSDERNRSFFQPIKDAGFDLVFLEDLFDDQNFDPNKLGMLEQLVAANPLSRTFTGTWFSTFSSYVARLRAYYGHRPDTVYYAAPHDKHRAMHDTYRSHHPEFPFYTREWALGWDGIDLRPPTPQRHDPRLSKTLPKHRPYADLPLLSHHNGGGGKKNNVPGGRRR